jgi:hypothetical protein
VRPIPAIVRKRFAVVRGVIRRYMRWSCMRKRLRVWERSIVLRRLRVLRGGFLSVAAQYGSRDVSETGVAGSGGVAVSGVWACAVAGGGRDDVENEIARKGEIPID